MDRTENVELTVLCLIEDFDSRVDKELIALGWTPIHFWSKGVKKNLKGCVHSIEKMILDNYA